MRTRIVVTLLLLGGSASAQLPSVRTLPPPDASSVNRYSTLVEVRPLSDGRILVNDPNDRRLVLLDDKLALIRVLFDSLTPAPLTYPHGTARLVVANGDSTWLGEPDARGFRVLDPEGRTVRRQALSDLNDLSALTNHYAGTGLDAHGDIIFAEAARPSQPGLGQPMTVAGMNIIRLHPNRPGRDTIGKISSGGTVSVMRIQVSSPAGAPTQQQSLQGPMMSIAQGGDAWAVLPSGTIAVVRGADFHVDWLGASGAWQATPRVPWPWRVLSGDEKRKLVDSAQHFFDSNAASRTATLRSPDGAVRTIPIAPTVVSPQVPDTLPAFVAMTGRADPRGRIWVREGIGLPGPIAGPNVYDVIDGRGQMVDRIQLEPGESLAAVGPNDVVYLQKQDGKRLQLLKCHIPRR